MPLPKRRHSRTRGKKRRSHDALVLPNPSPCPRCSEPKMPHRVCPACGYYQDRQVVAKEE